MAVLQGIDNESIMIPCKILQSKRCLQAGKNMPDEQELPVRKRVVRLRETTSFIPRSSESERICRIFS